MSTFVGAKLPAPLRFELGVQPQPDSAAQAVLLVTLDEDGSPRTAVLAPHCVAPVDDQTLRISVRAQGTTCANLMQRRHAALWRVLDGAAYTIKGHAAPIAGDQNQDTTRFEMRIASVWMDFDPSAAMIAGPTYRAPAEEPQT